MPNLPTVYYLYGGITDWARDTHAGRLCRQVAESCLTEQFAPALFFILAFKPDANRFETAAEMGFCGTLVCVLETSLCFPEQDNLDSYPPFGALIDHYSGLGSNASQRAL